MEPIFTDKEVRDLIYLHKLRHTTVEGDDTSHYVLAKAIRDAVENKLAVRSVEVEDGYVEDGYWDVTGKFHKNIRWEGTADPKVKMRFREEN